MKSPEEEREEADGPGLGWQLVMLRQFAREAGALAADIEERLEGVDPDALGLGGGVALSSSELSDLADGAAELHDLTDALAVTADNVASSGGPLVLSAEEIGEEAARALRQGTTQPRAAMLSARLLPSDAGVRALADGLMSDVSNVAGWDTLTIRELLCEFRESDPALVRRICLAAAIHPDTEWATLDVDALARVADALRTSGDV